jgi:hypothetical protein
MIARACLASLALVLSASLLPSAPAPFPGPKVAEAVLGVSNPGRGERLRATLSSPAFLQQVLAAPKVRALDSLRGTKDPLTWLRGRLKIDLRRQGQELHVRVANCRGSEALALLEAVVAAARGNAATAQHERQLVQLAMIQRQMAVQQIQVRMMGNVQVQAINVVNWQGVDDLLQPPSVVQKPRLVLPRD